MLPVHRQDILYKRERVGKLIWEKSKAKVGVAREKKWVREICKDTCACLFTIWGTGPKQVSLEVMMLTLTLVDSLSLKFSEVKQKELKASAPWRVESWISVTWTQSQSVSYQDQDSDLKSIRNETCWKHDAVTKKTGKSENATGHLLSGSIYLKPTLPFSLIIRTIYDNRWIQEHTELCDVCTHPNNPRTQTNQDIL